MKALPVPPLIRSDKFDYEDATYTSEIAEIGKGVVRVRHVLSGGNLVHNLVQNKEAVYACELISPKALYRELFISEPGNGAEQIINYESDLIIRDEALVRPVVISAASQRFTGKAEHGLHKSRVSRRFVFEKGWILADCGYYDLVSTGDKLFKFQRGSDLEPGTYRLVHDDGLDFTFKIYMASDLYDQIRKIQRTRSDLNSLFMTGVFANSLSYLVLLDKDSEENDSLIKQHRVLADLFEEMSEKLKVDVWGTIKSSPESIMKIASQYKRIEKIKFDDS